MTSTRIDSCHSLILRSDDCDGASHLGFPAPLFLLVRELAGRSMPCSARPTITFEGAATRHKTNTKAFVTCSVSTRSGAAEDSGELRGGLRPHRCCGSPNRGLASSARKTGRRPSLGGGGVTALYAAQEGGAVASAEPVREGGGQDEVGEVQRSHVLLQLAGGSLDVGQGEESPPHLLEPPVLPEGPLHAKLLQSPQDQDHEAGDSSPVKAVDVDGMSLWIDAYLQNSA